jgi:hypothetical protein
MRVLLVIGLVVCTLVSGCESGGDEGEAGASGASGSGGDGGGAARDSCNVTAPTACPSDAPTYEQDIKPIIEQRCVTCHIGNRQSELCPTCWGLTSYQHVADWDAVIRGAMLSCAMPPPDSGITMTDAERTTILEWIFCKLPE